MGKQIFNRAKKILGILFAIFFVIISTAASARAVEWHEQEGCHNDTCSVGGCHDGLCSSGSVAGGPGASGVAAKVVTAGATTAIGSN